MDASASFCGRCGRRLPSTFPHETQLGGTDRAPVVGGSEEAVISETSPNLRAEESAERNHPDPPPPSPSSSASLLCHRCGCPLPTSAGFCPLCGEAVTDVERDEREPTPGSTGWRLGRDGRLHAPLGPSESSRSVLERSPFAASTRNSWFLATSKVRRMRVGTASVLIFLVGAFVVLLIGLSRHGNSQSAASGNLAQEAVIARAGYPGPTCGSYYGPSGASIPSYLAQGYFTDSTHPAESFFTIYVDFLDGSGVVLGEAVATISGGGGLRIPWLASGGNAAAQQTLPDPVRCVVKAILPNQGS